MSATIILAFFLFSWIGCAKPPIKRTRLMFDTVVSISIDAPASLDIDSIFRDVWGILSEWESAADIYDSTSEIYVVNSDSGYFLLSTPLARAVSTGLAYRDTTLGTFDIRIGSLTEIWDFAGEGHIPTEIELDIALENMKTPIELAGDTIVKINIHPRLDLGGLIKGLAVDELYDYLYKKPEIDAALIDLGGNIRGFKRDDRGFNIGIRHPASANELAGNFKLESGMACATAGDYQRFFVVDGVRYHHILDPFNGHPARKCGAVTVLAPTGLDADIFSTALFVMGHEDGVNFLKTHSEIRAVFLSLIHI